MLQLLRCHQGLRVTRHSRMKILCLLGPLRTSPETYHFHYYALAVTHFNSNEMLVFNAISANGVGSNEVCVCVLSMTFKSGHTSFRCQIKFNQIEFGRYAHWPFRSKSILFSQYSNGVWHVQTHRIQFIEYLTAGKSERKTQTRYGDICCDCDWNNPMETEQFRYFHLNKNWKLSFGHWLGITTVFFYSIGFHGFLFTFLFFIN